MGFEQNGSTLGLQCIRTYNLSNPSDAKKWIYSETDKFILQVVIPGVSVVGITCNAAFLFMILRLPKMRTNLSAYLATLTLCDILFLVISNFCYALTLSQTDISLSWPTSSAMGCAGLIVSTHTWYYASVGLVTLISLERYFAICQPLKHFNFQGTTRNVKLILAVLIIALLITISITPRYTWYHTHCFIWPETQAYSDHPTTVGVCGTWSRYCNTYEGLLLVVIFILSAFGNAVLYARIIIALSSRDILKSSESTAYPNPPDTNRVRNQVARTLIINGVVFFICQIPYRIDNLDDAFDFLRTDFNILNAKQEATVTIVGQAFLFLNSVINPFIYVVSCQHYRQGILEAFMLKRKQVDNLRDPGIKSTSTTGSTSTVI